MSSMKIGYVVSMFPCWSETFILNELVSHDIAGVDLNIFSIKNSSEKMIHTEAIPFQSKTVYPLFWLNPVLWLLHLWLILSRPYKYVSILSSLCKTDFNDNSVRLKSFAVFFLSPRFVKEAKQLGIEHLHAHFATYPALLAWIVSSFCGTSYSITAHAHDIYINQDILRLIAKSVAKIFTISEFNKRFILDTVSSAYEYKLEVLHCGIEIKQPLFGAECLKQKNSQLQILSIGRLSGIKGFPGLLEALKLFHNEGYSFHCNIIGDGPLKSSLQNQISKLGLEQSVSLLGSKKSDEIPGYLEQADIFVLACSRDNIEGHDGIPLVFMEAMALGVPVIGTELSGIPELIQHGETGLCAKVDDPVSIKNNLVFFIENPEKMAKIRSSARELVESEFNIEIVGKRLRVFFAEKH